jgi:hypothetical protein
LFWEQKAGQIENKEKRLNSIVTSLRDALRQGSVTDLEISQKVALVKEFHRAMDWSLVRDFIEGEGDGFTAPQLPVLVSIGAGDDGGAVSDREWAIDALQAIWTQWNPATIGVPILIAVGLDLIVFLVAVLFRDRENEELSAQDVARAVLAAHVLDGRVSARAVRVLVSCLRAGRARRRRKWWLDTRDLRRLEAAAVAIVEQLERKRAIRPARLGRGYRVPAATYEGLASLALEQAPAVQTPLLVPSE